MWRGEINMFSLTKRQVAMLLGVVLLIAVAGWVLWQHYHQPPPVKVQSQKQAESPAGVELAAKNDNYVSNQ
jgi:hypothetical protein